MTIKNETQLTGKVTAEGEVMLFKYRDGDLYRSAVRKVEWSNGDIEIEYYNTDISDWCDVPSGKVWRAKRTLRSVEAYSI